MKKQTDWTNVKIFLLLGGIGALALAGVVFEALKFVALVKYVFS
jgi:hypothetical protein